MMKRSKSWLWAFATLQLLGVASCGDDEEGRDAERQQLGEWLACGAP